ncbi:MAG: helix-hairpin-helix domain-containing protein [Acidimicrobiales bacterium]
MALSPHQPADPDATPPDGADDLGLDPLVLGGNRDRLRRPGPAPWSESAAQIRERWATGASPARLAGAVVVLVLLAGGGWWLLRPAAPAVDATLPMAGAGDSTVAGAGTVPTGSSASLPAGAGAPGSSTTVATELVAQAAGAVARPGVYHLPGDGRVDDLVRAAGGLTPEADVDRVNLAAPLADGERVWVPKRGQREVPEVVAGGGVPGATGPGSGGTTTGSGGSGSEVVGPVDLNTATAEQLDTLPGVGPATAQSILAYREEHGRFASVDELLEVRGIGDAKLEQLRTLVTA